MSNQKVKKQSWPFITHRSYPSGATAWVVDARTKSGGIRKSFPTKSEAETFAQLEKIKRGNAGTDAFDETELSRYGWTVPKAIEFALAHLKQLASSKPIAEAVGALIEAKRGRVGGNRLSDIQNRLKKFSDFCAGKSIAEITPDDIGAFLDTIKHPTTRNDYRKEIVMLWHFAKGRSRQWVSSVMDKNDVPRAKEPDKARAILTVKQAIQLMSASIDDDIRALNALVLFAGVRREEAEKLDWSNIDFKTGHIQITGDVSKVSTERFAPMSDNLKKWLKPIAKNSGPIIARNLMHPLRRTWKKAGLMPWPADAHRHSFISYRRELVGDSMTAKEAGTSETIIKKHYKRPVTKADATKFFKISPQSVKKKPVKKVNKPQLPAPTH